MSHFSAQLTAGESEGYRRQAQQALSSGRVDEAVALLEKAHAANPESADICNELARACWRGAALEKADDWFHKAIALSPGDAFFYNSYGVFLLAQERYDDALPALERALALKPGFHEILNNLGLLHHRRGDPEAAEKYFGDAIAAQPAWPAAHGNLAALLRDMKQYDRAEAEYKEALKYAPGNTGGWHMLADFYKQRGRYEDALAILKRIMSQAPFNERAWLPILELQENMSRLDDAFATLADIKTRFAPSPATLIVEARLLRRKGRNDEAITVLSGLGGLPEGSPQHIGRLFELGQLYERTGDADAAFRCFADAKGAQSRSPEAQRIDRDGYIRSVARFRADFTPALAQAVRAAAKPGLGAPVFLVGFPRSGTTLLDQIISSHPRALVAEEEPVTNQLTSWLVRKYGGKPPAANLAEWLLNNPCYPSCLAEITDEDAAELRRLFFRGHGVDPAGDRTFVDKLPLNVHAIRYEDVVADFRPTVAALLDFLGLEWNDAVLEYDKTAQSRGIATPSYHQVTEKIYTRASGRWQKYRQHLGAVIPLLKPHAEKRGYSIE